jgi:uridine kinase
LTVFKQVGGAKNAVYLTHDHYYKDISHLTVQERSKTNFDHPDSLDTDLLVQHIRQLKSGKTADLPNYDFATHSRTPITDLVHPKPIIIVEGILILTSADLCKECDIKVFVVRCLSEDEKVKDSAAKLILYHLLSKQ